MRTLGGDTNNRPGEVPKASQGIVPTMLTRVCIGPERPASRGKSHRIGLGARGVFNKGASLRGLSGTIWPQRAMIAISTFSYTFRCKLRGRQVTSLKPQLDKSLLQPSAPLLPRARWHWAGRRLSSAPLSALPSSGPFSNSSVSMWKDGPLSLGRYIL